MSHANNEDRIDAEADAQEDHQSMVESQTDRQVRFGDDPESEAAFRCLDAVARARKLKRQADIIMALQLLRNHVNGGMDYPDAEDRVQSEFSLTSVQVRELRRRYDAGGVVCLHEPDFSTITHSDQAVGDMSKECILDVNCKHCGLSGAFRVDATTEIDW